MYCTITLNPQMFFNRKVHNDLRKARKEFKVIFFSSRPLRFLSVHCGFIFFMLFTYGFKVIVGSCNFNIFP